MKNRIILFIRVPSTDRTQDYLHSVVQVVKFSNGVTSSPSIQKVLKRWPLWEAMGRLQPQECSPGLSQRKIFHFLT